MKAAKEVLQRAFRVLPGMEAREVSNNLFQTVHELQTRRAHFARSRAQRSARRRKKTAAD